ncbi:MAG: primosomal protein N' [Actinomycetota bacterium]|nr:primosomal protein N' [Actinomycetota bacterium]
MPQKPLIANIVVDLPVKAVDRIFDYEVPFALSARITVGSLVVVPFGPTKQVGYVFSLSSDSEIEKLAKVEAVLEEHPAFDEHMVELCAWLADYYLSMKSEAIKLALPPGQSRKIIQSAKIVARLQAEPTQRQSEVYQVLENLGGDSPVEAIKKVCGASAVPVIKKLEQAGLIERYYRLDKQKVKTATERYAVATTLTETPEEILDSLARAPKQRKLMEILLAQDATAVSKLLAEAQAPHASLKALMERGLARIEERAVNRDPEHHFSEQDSEVELTDEQQSALLAIATSLEGGAHDVFLLQGVTGSGKTEVYLRAIKRALDAGKGAIALVPEIALTAQAVARFKARFGETVAVLHSGLGAGERFDQWRGIQEGRYRVVVGARSALFAPVYDIGIIIVDEEHEASYKQGRSPRYHARDVAIKRGELENAVVVLGSATPSLESKYHSEVGLYEPLFLRSRVEQREFPGIEVVDMREEPFEKPKSSLGRLLKQRLAQTLEAGEKAILFINRRGFSNFVICEECGFVPKCRNCAVSLTFHSINNSLRCHHCNYATRALQACPKCKGHRIAFPGSGTQRIETELADLHPDVPVIRMDADTTSRKGAHQKRLAHFQQEKSAILLGTQMIAKGLDFPEITLVGIVNADTSIHLPDFRAAEHTLQILMQVSGRAGRGELPGRVVIQTHVPESYPLRAVLDADYEGFYKTELEFRRELNYPPFSGVIRMVISGNNPEIVVGLTKRAAKIIDTADLGDAATLIGPSPAPLLKVKQEYRWHILLKVFDDSKVKTFLADNFHRFVPDKYKNEVSLTIDVDPVWVL